MTDSLRASYEAAPYESRAIIATHIDGLASIARFRGMTPAPATHCRVLELGGASGGNIIPMAIEFPESTFIGVDLAPSQIAEGQAIVDRLELENVKLVAGSILDIGDDVGVFDYIICHGVYSWVPAEVQDAILRICSRHLAPHGVAYVSYNAYPGWHARMLIREMLMENDIPTLPPAERVARARAFAERLASEEVNPPTLHFATVREQAVNLRKQTDRHLLHEQLEPFNSPVYFAEFVRRAERHGLRYLAEAPMSETRGARAALQLEGEADGDEIRAEQYFDYVRGRMFRRTLLCHGTVDVRSDFDEAIVPEMHATIRAHPVNPSAEDRALDPNVQAFASDDSITMSTNNPLVIATLTTVGGAGPASISFPDLVAGVRDRLRGSPAESTAADSSAIATVLLRFATGGFITLRPTPSRFCSVLSERPVASVLARLQAETNDFVTGLQHHPIRLSGIELMILPLLDGEHDRGQLARAAEKAFADGRIVMPDETPDAARIGALVDTALERLRIAALLIS